MSSADADREFKVVVKTTTGRSIDLVVDSKTTVAKIKQKIYETDNDKIPVKDQELRLEREQPLTDTQTLAELGAKPHAIFDLRCATVTIVAEAGPQIKPFKDTYKEMTKPGASTIGQITELFSKQIGQSVHCFVKFGTESILPTPDQTLEVLHDLYGQPYDSVKDKAKKKALRMVLAAKIYLG